MTQRIESHEAFRRLEADAATRRRIGEQAFQVEHYLAYWRCYPTAANWQRVIDAAESFYPLLEDDGPEVLKRRLRKGERIYFTFTRGGGTGPRSNRTALGRYSRVGARGCIYEQVYRKGSKSWTRER
jgi:hypothetical protein